MKQIIGEPNNNAQSEIIDLKKEEDDYFTPIINLSMVQQVPQCRMCGAQDRMFFDKKKRIFQWIDCQKCNGFGLDLEYLERYRTSE